MSKVSGVVKVAFTNMVEALSPEEESEIEDCRTVARALGFNTYEMENELGLGLPEEEEDEEEDEIADTDPERLL